MKYPCEQDCRVWRHRPASCREIRVLLLPRIQPVRSASWFGVRGCVCSRVSPAARVCPCWKLWLIPWQTLCVRSVSSLTFCDGRSDGLSQKTVGRHRVLAVVWRACCPTRHRRRRHAPKAEADLCEKTSSPGQSSTFVQSPGYSRRFWKAMADSCGSLAPKILPNFLSRSTKLLRNESNQRRHQYKYVNFC